MTTANVELDGATLQQFVGATESRIAAGLTKTALESAARQDSAALQGWVTKTDGVGVRAELAGHVVGFLQGSMGEIFAGVWAKCAELRVSAAETKEKKGVTELVALAEHEFIYAVDPSVAIVLDGAPLGTFRFSIQLLCTVKSVELQVRDGAVTAVRTGECEGSTAILLAGTEVWRRAFVHADLPGTLLLKRPLRIV